MSLNLFLIQLVALTCVVMVVQAHRLPRGWLLVFVILVAVLVGSFVTVPQAAGLISGWVWLLLIVLPIAGFTQVSRLVSQERYSQARRIASWLRWLHPADGFVEYPELLRGLELGQRGELAEAEQIFDRYRTRATATGRLATALFYRISARWDELQKWAQSIPEKTLYQELALAANYLRSLGETGKLNELLQAVVRFEQTLGRSNNATSNLVRLYALAFCGELEPVQALLDRTSGSYSSATRQFWWATTQLAAGQLAIGRDMLLQLSNSTDTALNNAIQWRLAQPIIDPQLVLTASSQQILTQLKRSLQHEARYSSQIAFTKPSYATYALIGINLFTFAGEIIAGGSENLEVLYRLGAMVPADLVAGQWWRSLTALFLHAGVLHLTANLIGLYFFGALVEAVLGSRKFLICYFFSGIGSMLTVAVLPLLFDSPPQITVGASGAVLGIVGAEAAIQLKGWRFEQAQVARDRLRLILFAVVLQIFSDLLTPQVSLVAHASGLLLGFGAGISLFRVKEARKIRAR